MSDLPAILAAHNGSGYVLAPAGFGKTHLIAEAVKLAERRQLVLTHTFAGVSAIRRKMRICQVPAYRYQIDTIASWALRFACAYPSVSKWTNRRPETKQWPKMYGACTTLLDTRFARAALQASYQGVYVDEYQDCTTEQHALVVKLARDLPCRILGDPMQGIFDFGEQIIDWPRDVAGMSAELGTLQTPERWDRVGTPTLGGWLQDVRKKLDAGAPIDLANGLPNGVTYKPATEDYLLRVQASVCRSHLGKPSGHTVAAIHGGDVTAKGKCHRLARSLGGNFSSIEEVEGKDLFRFFGKLAKESDSKKQFLHVIAFAKLMLTAVKENLSAATKRCEKTDIRSNTKNPGIAKAANAYLDDPSSAHMLAFLQELHAVSAVNVFRADLYDRASGVLRKHIAHPQLTLAEAVEKYQSEFRHRGRFGGRRRIIGTTHLLKGLEFEHGIVLDAASLTKKHLYVALTRASRSLTIISTSPTLNPTA